MFLILNSIAVYEHWGLNMDAVVLSLGGSVLLPEKDGLHQIRRLASLLKEEANKWKLYVVVGGGRIARFYIEIGRELGADESYLDDVGIDVTRLNAKLFILALGNDAYHLPATSFDEALTASKSHEIVVMGGTHPGHTTDAVAAMLSERVRAKRLINATSVDGVYTSDPKKNPGAKRIEKMRYEQLLHIVRKCEGGAGPHTVFDTVGVRVLLRSRIPLLVVDGRDLDSLKNAIEGKRFRGTIVR